MISVFDCVLRCGAQSRAGISLKLQEGTCQPEHTCLCLPVCAIQVGNLYLALVIVACHLDLVPGHLNTAL